MWVFSKACGHKWVLTPKELIPYGTNKVPAGGKWKCLMAPGETRTVTAFLLGLGRDVRKVLIPCKLLRSPRSRSAVCL